MRVTVNYKRKDLPEFVRSKTMMLMAKSGNALRNLMIKESKLRPDGLGGDTGAVDTGMLSNSIVILQITPSRVAVGTNIKYASQLASGRANPGVRLEAIRKWATRKDLPEDARGLSANDKKAMRDNFIRRVTAKISKVGPIKNPFHERAKKQFIQAFPGILQEVKNS